MEIEIKAKNYVPGSMSWSEGFLGPKGDVGFFMMADMEKAKQIITKLQEQGKQISSVEMGLDGDWGENSMTIYEDSVFTDYNLYCSSIWATPIIIVNYDNAPSEAYDCFSKGKPSK